jgi:hypothetical protein
MLESILLANTGMECIQIGLRFSPDGIAAEFDASFLIVSRISNKN